MANTDPTPLRPHPRKRRDSIVVLPTYNEAQNLRLVVPEILRSSPYFDVLVVDDDSPDGTGELAEQLAVEHPGRVRVLHRPGKLGLGRAYIDGFRHALALRYPRIFEMDADLSHDPAALPSLREALDSADVVLGSRYVCGGATLHWPIWRRTLSQAGSLYAALVLGLPFHDLTGGFKGFSAKVLRALDLDAIQSNGYAFQIEMTYRAYQLGFRIVERPIVFADRRLGESKMHGGIVTEALRVVWDLRRAPAPTAVTQPEERPARRAA